MAKKRRKGQASQAEINHAEWLFVERGLKPEAIAEELERDIKTIYRWREDGKWDDKKELFDLGPTELKRILMEAAIRVAKGEKRTDTNGNEVKEIDADAISKIMKAYDYMSKKVSPEVVRDVLIECDNYISQIEPEDAVKITQYHKMFLIFKIDQDNGN
ncbi:hypothetical protein [Limibacterium fermenti]|uniref:hypothetical protein n=1 Tax=Limibacterium fermenti TaxID=3229863 RepID=UPI003A764E87